MDLKEAIYRRRSIREFTAEFDEKTIRDLIDAAIQVPSAVNKDGIMK
jgi:nitroreductase